MSERLKLKLMGRSVLKGKVGAHFPTSIVAQSPVDVDQVGNAVAITLDQDALRLFSATQSGIVPASGGGIANFLRADGNWAPGGGGGGSAAGTNTQIQFNDALAFGADADFTWNKTTNQLAFGAGSSMDWGAGDVTLTHSLNALTITGATDVSITVTGNFTTGTIQLGNLSDTTLSRFAAGKLAVEGSEVLTALTGQPLDSDLSAIANLATNGLIVRTGTGTAATRTLTFGGSAGLSITNGDGVAANPTINLSNDLNALEALSGTNNIYYRSGVDTWSPVTIGSNLTFAAGTLSASTGTATVGDADYGDIVVTGTGTVWTIDVNVVGNTKLADMASATVKGQIVGGSGDPVDLTATQLMTIIQTVDGSGSGLDADLLDGNNSTFFATATALSSHTGAVTGAHPASAISVTATGNIASTDVQAALAELDTEKQPLDADLTSWALITRATGFDTFVATPSSANLAALVTGETGTGSLVFSTSPTLVTPVLGTPTSGTLTNCSGLPSVLVANEATDTTCFPAFFTAATGELGPKTNANLTFNSATGVLSNLGSPVLTTTSGAASLVAVANEATDPTCFVGFYTDPSGNLAAKTNANMTFNALTGVVTFASSVLTTTDINGGTVDGTVIGGAVPAAGTFTAAVANSFVPNSATVPTNGTYLPAVNTLGWAIAGNAELQLTGTALSPAVDGGNSLGTATLSWQNLFGNTGFVWNIENGDWVATHTAGIVTVGTGDLRITTAGTNAASVVTVGGTQTLTNKTIAAGSNTITGLTTTSIAAATLVDSTDTIALNDNDTTWPTTAAIIDFAQPLDPDLSAVAGLSTTGLIVRTGAGTAATRSLTAPAAGITISNNDGVAGNPTFALANDLAALEALSGTNNIYYRSGADTWSTVLIGANLTFSGGTLAASSGTATVGDGDYGDIVVSGTGTVWTIDTNAVTYAKMQDVSAASKLIGRGDSGAGDPQEITLGTGLTMTGTTLSSSGGTGAPLTAQYVVLALDASLTAERVLVAGGGLTLTDGGANGNATLAVGAGTGITVNADDVAIDTAVVARKTDNLSVFAATTSAQLAGVISDETGSGLLVFGTSPILTTPQIQDLSSTNQYIFAASELTANRTVTLPLLTGNDTFVFEAFAQTLTNKTIALGSNTISGTTAQFNTALSDGDFATLAGTETLTGKTINLTSNTLTGTTAQFNAALSDNDFATLAGTETLLNKTLTLPAINDTSSTNQYVFAVNELAANRTITLPLLTAGDTFVFEAFAQTLTNKTLTSPTIGGSPTASGATWTNLGAVTTIDINGGTLDNVAIGGAVAAAAVVTTLTSQTHLPAADGTYDLGSTTLAWNNLHLDTGATINIENGNWLATHTTGLLTVGTGDLAVTTAGTSATSVVTRTGTQTLTNKTIDLGGPNTLTGTVAQFNTALSGADFYTTGGTDVALADGGTGASLTAPTVDRLLMWDQGGTTVAFGTTSNITTYASPTTGDFVLVQRASTDDLVKVDWASLPGAGGGAPSTASYLTLALDGTLSAERVLTAGNGIAFVDGGANTTLTISADAASTTVDGIVELATNAEQLTGTDATRAATPDSIAALWERGSDVASAATVSLGDGGYFHITGTTTITDIDFATVPTNNGRPVILQFDAALTLTHNATTLVLPGGANITTAAGDCALVVQDSGDNVKVVDYFRANGQAIGSQPLDATLTALAAYSTNGLLTQTAADTFIGRSIAGTTNRITITDGAGSTGNPTVDIAATYVGQTSITTLGTVTAGTWTGTDIAFANIAQGTARSVLGVTGNATADLASIQGTTNQVLRVDSAGTGLSFGAIALNQAAAVTGTLAVANGGTGQTTADEAIGELIQALTEDTAPDWTADFLAAYDASADTGKKIEISTIAREILTANRTYYVRTDGSDSNNGLADTAGGAFLTVQKGIDAASILDARTFDVTVQVRAGTYTASGVPVAVLRPTVGVGTFLLTGDTTTPANVVLNATNPSTGGSGTISAYAKGAKWSVSGFKIQSTTAGYGIRSEGTGSVITISGNMDFGAVAAGYAHVVAVVGGQVLFTVNNYTISGGGAIHISAFDYGLIQQTSGTVTISGSPTFTSNFVSCRCAEITTFSQTFSGTVTVSGARYSVSNNGVVTTNNGGATYYPGATAGTVTNGGFYS